MQNRLQIIRKYPILFFGLLILITYGNTLSNGYNFDDHLVTINHHLTSANSKNSFFDIFTMPYYSDKMGYNYGYRPITMLSFYIENHLLGENPHISHLINVLLFCITVITLYKFILSLNLKGGENIAIIASIFFALHPIHTEVVNSIKNRDELLSLLFGLLSFKTMLKFEGKNHQVIVYSCILFAIGLLSKKSILPLAYIMPITLTIVRKVNYRYFLTSAIPLITTAFFVGGGLSSSNVIIFVLVSISYLIFIFLFYKWENIIQWLRSVQISTRIKVVAIIILQALIYVHVLWSKQFITLLLGVPLYFYLFKLFGDSVLYIIIIQSLFIDWFTGYHDFGLISVFISLGLLLKDHTNNQLNSKIIILTLVTIFLFNYNNFLPILNAATILVTVLFFYTIERKFTLSWIVTIGTIAGAIYFKDNPILGILMLSGIILKYVTQKQPSRYFIPATVVVVLFAIMLYPSIKLNTELKPEKKLQPVSKSIAENNKSNGEGRSLSFVENPLVNNSNLEELAFTGFSVLGTYLYLNTFPLELSYYYGYSKINVCNSKDPMGWISLILYITLFFIAVWRLKKQPLIAIGIFWYIVSILLFSNWIELVAGVIGERLSYVASAGFSIFISGLIFWALPDFMNKKYQLVRLIITLVFVIFFFKTIDRNTFWASPVKLMNEDINHLSNSAQANNMLAIVLMSEVQKANSLPEKERLLEKALSHFKKTISIYPNFFNAHIDIARVYILQGRLNEAKRHLIIAYNIDPKSILVLEELIKINFDTQNLYAVLNYADQYLKLDEKNQLVYELVTHLLYVNSHKSLALKYAKLGLAQFPQNQNLLYLTEKLFHPNGN